MINIPVIENARTEDYTALSSHSRVKLAVNAAVKRAKKPDAPSGLVILHVQANRLFEARWYVAIPRR